MANIEFEDDYQSNNRYDTAPKGMVAWLINNGLAKNQNMANIILIIVAVLVFATSIFFFRRASGPRTTGSTDIADNPFEEEFLGF